jgi:hypothetical protein
MPFLCGSYPSVPPPYRESNPVSKAIWPGILHGKFVWEVLLVNWVRAMEFGKSTSLVGGQIAFVARLPSRTTRGNKWKVRTGRDPLSKALSGVECCA